MTDQLAELKRAYRQVLREAPDGLPFCAPDVAWHGPHPLNEVQGAEPLARRVWGPLRAALPDLERRDDIFFGGLWQDRPWLCAAGHYVGSFVAPWLGIPPTHGPLAIRFGEFSRVDDGRIVESYVILDLIDVLRQAGIRVLPPALGVDERAPGPATADGVLLGPADAAAGRRSLELVEAMIAGLGSYDGRELASMGQARFWSPTMMWYGPGGIGTTRGLRGFEEHHQRPFLTAFPDRRGGGHKARLAEGAYVGSTGWPSVLATHTGGGWLGCPPTGRRVGMRVMDFWRRDGDRLAENWVFIDIVDLLRQMDVDLLARLPAHRP